MADLNASVEKLADAGLWEQAIATGAGYMGASVAQTILDGMSPYDIPNEAYGAGVAVAGQYSPQYQNEITVGGALYTADALAQRMGVKSEITALAEQQGGN